MTAVRRRTRRLLAFVVALHAVLVGRLFWLQVVEGAEWKRHVESQQTVTQRLRPRRGAIFDREGRPLATDSPRYDLFLLSRDLDDRTWRCERCLRTVHLSPRTRPRRCLDCGGGAERFVDLTVAAPERYAPIAAALGMPVEEVVAAIAAALGEARSDAATMHEPQPVIERLSPAVRLELELNPFRYPGLEVRAVRGRHYSEPTVMPHVVGGVGKAFATDLESLGALGFERRDLWGMRLGREGLELRLNERLVGRMGFRRVAYHRAGRVIEVLDETPPTPGEDVTLSIDLDLQRAGESALDRLAGRPSAFLAIDVRTGELLTAATAPRFAVSDPALRQEMYRRPVETQQLYFRERSYGEGRTPGSVFKVVTAYALVQQPGFDPRATVHCDGAFRRGRRPIRCNARHGHGEVDLVAALQRSCNVYFMAQSVGLGAETLAARAAELGVGAAPDVEVALGPGSRGLNVDPALVRRTPAELWYNAFGQGNVQTTPLQMARIAALIANDGRLPPLTFLSGGAAAKEWVRLAPAGRLDPIRDGLRRAVTQGTARGQGLDRFAIAAKTGTAEIGDGDNRAWLVGYAPHDAPEVAFACLVDETGGHGADECAPIVVEWFEAWAAKRSTATESARAPVERGER